MEYSFNYLPLLVVFSVAWLVPMMLSWLSISKIPAVIVEIMVGIVVGPHLLNILGPSHHVDFLAYTGFLFLIFLSGVEVDARKVLSSFPRRITPVKLISNSFLVASIIYVASLLLAFIVALILTWFFNIDVLFFTILLPTVALSIVVPVLKQGGDIAKKYGQIILMEAAIATIMSIILISLYAGIIKTGFKTELILFVVIFITFYVGYKIGERLNRFKIFQKQLYKLQHASSQIKVRGSVVLLLLFVLVASLIGVEMVLGAFLAGALLSLFLFKERSSLMIKLDGMGYGFFIPIFFIMVGANLDLAALAALDNAVSLVVALVLAFYVTQLVPSAALIKLFGLKRAISAGTLLSCRLGLTIAAAQIGMELQLISVSVNAAIVIASIITSVISPMLFNQLRGNGEKSYSTIIIGGTQVGILLAERMKMHGYACVILESDHLRFQKVHSLGLESANGNPLDPQTYQSLNLRPEHHVVVVTGNSQLNMDIAYLLRNSLNHGKIITKVNGQANAAKLKAQDIQVIDLPTTIATNMENMMFRPAVYHTLIENFGSYTVEEIIMTNSDLDRRKVKSVPFHAEGTLVLIKRNREILVPHGDTRLLYGDMITVVGNATALEDFRTKLQKDWSE